MEEEQARCKDARDRSYRVVPPVRFPSKTPEAAGTRPISRPLICLTAIDCARSSLPLEGHGTKVRPPAGKMCAAVRPFCRALWRTDNCSGYANEGVPLSLTKVTRPENAQVMLSETWKKPDAR